MGVSWVLECIKCRKAYDVLCEVEHYDAAEALESSFYLYTIEDDKPDNVERLVSWINKHKNHGGIRFTGYA